MLELNESSFRDTAEAVHVMNDAIKDRWATAEDVYQYMVNCAYGQMHKSASFGTAGFELTAFESRGKRHVRASVAGYTARKFTEQLELDQYLRSFNDESPAEQYAADAAASGQLALLDPPDPDDRRAVLS